MTDTIHISISYDSLKSKIKSNLAVMGKRYIDSNGHLQFSKVTVSSAEETLLADFVHNAIHTVISAIIDLVHNYKEVSSTYNFDVINTRWSVSSNDSFKDAFAFTVSSFCVMQALADFYAFYFNEQSQYYNVKAAATLNEIKNLCYYKQPSESALDMFEAPVTTII
jgi:hypothetical protein